MKKILCNIRKHFHRCKCFQNYLQKMRKEKRKRKRQNYKKVFYINDIKNILKITSLCNTLHCPYDDHPLIISSFQANYHFTWYPSVATDQCNHQKSQFVVVAWRCLILENTWTYLLIPLKIETSGYRLFLRPRKTVKKSFLPLKTDENSRWTKKKFARPRLGWFPPAVSGKPLPIFPGKLSKLRMQSYGILPAPEAQIFSFSYQYDFKASLQWICSPYCANFRSSFCTISSCGELQDVLWWTPPQP